MQTTKAVFGVLAVTAGLIMQSHICRGASWVGTDDFSSGLSTANWTVVQYVHGQMLAVGVNGHVSFIVPIGTVDEQNAYILWKGTPAGTNDWTADISGHNNASWANNGSSQLQLFVADMFVADTASLSTTSNSTFGISMRRGSIDATHPFSASFISFIHHRTAEATNANFGLRLVHRGGVAGSIEVWYDPTGNGVASTLLVR